MIHLPADILLMIDSYLPIQDFIKFHSTCRQLRLSPLAYHDKNVLLDIAIFYNRTDELEEIISDPLIDLTKFYRGSVKEYIKCEGCFGLSLEVEGIHSMWILLKHHQAVELLGILGGVRNFTKGVDGDRITEFSPDSCKGAREIERYFVAEGFWRGFKLLYTDPRFSDLLEMNLDLLHDVCYFGRTDMLEFIFENTNLSANQLIGYDTPLSIACQKGHIEIVRIVLNDTRPQKWMPWTCQNLAYKTALAVNHKEIAELLLAYTTEHCKN